MYLIANKRGCLADDQWLNICQKRDQSDEKIKPHEYE